jgi:putative phosphoribosyl transferase
MHFIPTAHPIRRSTVRIEHESFDLSADLNIPVINKPVSGIVLFCHEFGSRSSARDKYMSDVLNYNGIATMLIDLLSDRELKLDQETMQYRYDIDLLSDRLSSVCKWVKLQDQLKDMKIGLYGVSSGGAAALVTAARHEIEISAIVIRSGRADMAGEYLRRVTCPTLIIVGSLDWAVLKMNQMAFRELLNVPYANKAFEIVEGASHFFKEPGMIEIAGRLTKDWFNKYLVFEVVTDPKYKIIDTNTGITHV